MKTKQLTLGDLILAIASCSKNKRERVATVLCLLKSGRVKRA